MKEILKKKNPKPITVDERDILSYKARIYHLESIIYRLARQENLSTGQFLTVCQITNKEVINYNES